MENQINIEKYLNDQMSKEERRAFEQQLKEDFELRKAVDFQKRLKSFMVIREPKLEQQLEQLGNQYFDKKGKRTVKYLWVGVVGLTITVATILFLTKEENTVSNQKVETIDTVKTTKAPLIEPVLETDSIKPIKPEPPKKEIAPSPAAPNENKPTPKKENRPIAQLNPKDFEPNPFLEDLMQSNLRNDDAETTVWRPKKDVPLPYEEKIVFQVSGTTYATPPYRILLYTNKISDFEEDIQLLNAEFEGTPNETVFNFNLEKEIILQRGLYYFLIEQIESEELLLISKFEVR